MYQNCVVSVKQLSVIIVTELVSEWWFSKQELYIIFTRTTIYFSKFYDKSRIAFIFKIG